MDLERILKPDEVVERLKHARKQLINGYYFILIHPDMRDRIIELLKEQEPVNPTWSRGKPYCGSCGLRIHGGKFCGECGKPIAWGR